MVLWGFIKHDIPIESIGIEKNGIGLVLVLKNVRSFGIDLLSIGIVVLVLVLVLHFLLSGTEKVGRFSRHDTLDSLKMRTIGHLYLPSMLEPPN